VTTFVVILLGLLPGFIWLLFYLHEDLHPEPKRLVALVFFAGIISAFAALFFERILNGVVSASILTLASPITFGMLLYLFALAAIEEAVKFGAAWFSVHKNAAFDEPVDAMFYMAVAALGFATVENLGALNLAAAGGTPFLGGALATISTRFVGATLLHTLASGFVGYYWALGIREFKRSAFIPVGLALATLVHGIFNYLVIDYGNLIYMVAFIGIVGFFVISDFERLKRRTI